MTAAGLPPYAALLGIDVATPANGSAGPVLRMADGHAAEGRPGALHGGAIAGLLDMAAHAALVASIETSGDALQVMFKPIGITIDYVRGGRMVGTFARGRVTRVGQRVATVVVEAWQDDAATPIAAARLHFLLSRANAL